LRSQGQRQRRRGQQAYRRRDELSFRVQVQILSGRCSSFCSSGSGKLSAGVGTAAVHTESMAQQGCFCGFAAKIRGSAAPQPSGSGRCLILRALVLQYLPTNGDRGASSTEADPALRMRR
jgi:hypothetical protein